MAIKVKLKRRGVQEILNSRATRNAVNEVARTVAARVSAPGYVPVVVQEYTTDRVVAAVDLQHPVGVGLEAKYGYLARAAAACGLQVRRR